MTEEAISLAKGASISSDTWTDFVERLKHDCVGEGVHDHYTADAIFIVQARKLIYGIDTDYTDKCVIICDGSEWFSPQEYWDCADERERELLNSKAEYYSWREGPATFCDIDLAEQLSILADLDDHMVTGYDETWEYVNSHFTKAAAEAFIARKKHDYPKGLRVYVDAQLHCWEYNTIKEAMMNGSIAPVQNPWKPITEPFPHNVPLLVQFRYPQGGRENKLAKYADRFTLTADEDWEDAYEYNEADDTYYCPEGWYEKCPSYFDYEWWLVSKSDAENIAYWMEIPKVEE